MNSKRLPHNDRNFQKQPANLLDTKTLDTAGQWVRVLRGERIRLNPSETPLEIKTESELGSGDEVAVEFYSLNGGRAGGIRFLFDADAIRYNLEQCGRNDQWTEYPTNVPSDRSKVWRIYLDRTSGVTVVLNCNDVEVLRIKLSDKVCKVKHSRKNIWRAFWSETVEDILFSEAHDKASDFYRAQPKSGSLLKTIEI